MMRHFKKKLPGKNLSIFVVGDLARAGLAGLGTLAGKAYTGALSYDQAGTVLGTVSNRGYYKQNNNRACKPNLIELLNMLHI